MTERNDSIDREVERVRRRLRTCVERTDIPRRRVARAAELTEAELTEILRERGAVLRYEHVHAVLAALDVTPRDFFAELYGLRERGVQSRGKK